MTTPSAIEDIIRHTAASYEKHNGHPPTTLAISTALFTVYDRARVKAAAAALGIDLTDHDGTPL